MVVGDELEIQRPFGARIILMRNRWLRSKTRLPTGYFPSAPPAQVSGQDLLYSTENCVRWKYARSLFSGRGARWGQAGRLSYPCSKRGANHCFSASFGSFFSSVFSSFSGALIVRVMGGAWK